LQVIKDKNATGICLALQGFRRGSGEAIFRTQFRYFGFIELFHIFKQSANIALPTRGDGFDWRVPKEGMPMAFPQRESNP